MADSINSKDSNIAESALPKLSEKNAGSSSIQHHQYGLISAIFIIVNSIIGSGIFSTPASVYKHAGSVGLSLMLWLAGGFISLCGSLMALEVSTLGNCPVNTDNLAVWNWYTCFRWIEELFRTFNSK